jgi:Ca2+-binding RTX toxin-like protein
MVQVSFSTSTTFEGEFNALIEDQDTSLTVNFELDEPAPDGGLKVFVDSNIEQIVNRLDLPGFAFNPIAENINPSLLGTSFDNSGFYLTIDEGATSGSFTIDIFDNEEPDTFLPETFDGLVEANFSLVAPGEVEPEDLGDVGTLGDYTIDPDAATSTVLFADEESQLTPEPEPPLPEPPEPPMSGLPLVSLNTGPDYLVEEEGTVSAHVFNITGGTIPSEGLVVSVNAPNLSEFNLDGINVSEGGEIVAVRENGFDIRLTDFTVLVDLPITNDGETEGLETASFSLVAGDGYQVNTEVFSGEFSLVDTASEVPADALNQRNDIIPLAVETGLSADNPTFTATTSIAFDIGNRYENEDGTFTYVDMTEDVDIYSFELSAGDVITADVDSDSQRGEPPAAVSEYDPNPVASVFTGLRIFDSEGEELLAHWIGQGPGELFTSYDGYVEFLAPEDGTYYLGISSQEGGEPEVRRETFGIEIEKYDPFVPGSGDYGSFPRFDFPSYGEYDLTISLNPDVVLELPQFATDGVGGGNPNSYDEPEAGEPVVSLNYATGTFDIDTDDLVSPYLSEGLPSTNSALILTFSVEGDIPEEGIVVDVNSDNYLRQYVAARAFQSPPFTPGSQLEQFIYDETGRETGFQLRIFEPYTFISLSTQSPGWADFIEPDVDEPEDVTWFVEPGEDYAVAPDAAEIVATYYEPGETPEPSVIPEVGMTISETELIESEQTATTLTFTLSEPPPEEGVLVQVDGSGEGILQQFDIFNIEIDGGVFPSPTEVFTGFLFKITEQEATITLPAFEDPFDEGLQGFSFSLADAAHYTVDPDAGEVAYTIADTPDSVVQVSLSGDGETLVESENPTGVLTFNLTAEPPEDGITVNVDAPNLSEFDVEALTATGGEITEITDAGFSLNITDTTATVELLVLADGESEGLETATFALVDSTDSTINPETNEATLTLVDNPNQVPVTAELDANDTIEQALDINLSSANPDATIRGGLFSTEPEQTGGLGGFWPLVNDPSEDVDFYKFDLNAGDTVEIDVDAVGVIDDLSLYPGVELRLDSELRLLDADGNELASVNNAAAPDEEFSRDPYLEFTAEEAGTYYVGVSQLGNNNYDPDVAGSGSGWIFPEIGVYVGEYDLNVSLTGDRPTDIIGTDDSETLDGNDADNLVAGLLGDDTIFGRDGNDTLRGDANSRSPGGSVGGDDVISGGAGNDQIGGKAGNDLLSGDEGDDLIWGDAGNDTIMGVTGNDTLTGDDFSGGSGSDLFVFGNGDGTDTITDFDITEDLIGLVEGELTFDEIAIADSDMGAMISVIETGETLAILQGVDSDELTSELFTITPDLTFG